MKGSTRCSVRPTPSKGVPVSSVLTTSRHFPTTWKVFWDWFETKSSVPNPENINFLLLASDALKGLLIHVEESDEMDISDHVDALSSITDYP